MAVVGARLGSIGSGLDAWRGPQTAVAVLGAAAVGAASTRVDDILLLTAVGALVVMLVALRSPRSVAVGTLLILPFIGLVRRATNSYTASLDPLAVIGPLLAGVCLFVLAHGEVDRHRSALGRVVLAMVGLGVLQVVNPAQGGPAVGVVGAGLFVGPMVWFFVGRRLGDARTLAFLNRALAVIAVIAAAYGTKQLLLGFTGFEERWIAARLPSYAALNISGSIRPFSTFASGAEYSYFLVLGAILLTVRSGPPRKLLRAATVLILLLACFYAGSRGIFVTGLVAVLTAALAHRIRHLGRALVLCAAIGLAGLALLQFVPFASEDTAAADIRNRTLAGLTRPFDREASTLGLHLDAFGRGVEEGLRNPVGRGAGAVNLAGSKLRGTSVSAEHDIPNVLLAYGWAGGALLVLLAVHIYKLVRACVRWGRPEAIGPAVFVLALFGVWFAGELYAASALLWFFVGSLDRLVPSREDELSLLPEVVGTN